jgi:hypothetical protein
VLVSQDREVALELVVRCDRAPQLIEPVLEQAQQDFAALVVRRHVLDILADLRSHLLL